MCQRRLDRRVFRVLLFAVLALITFVLLFVVATLLTESDDSKEYHLTLEDFHTNPAVVTALFATQTAKAWTVTPSLTSSQHGELSPR